MSGDCGSLRTQPAGALNIVHQEQCDRRLSFQLTQASQYIRTTTEQSGIVSIRTQSEELTGVFRGERGRQSHHHNCHLKPPPGRPLMTPRYSIKTFCHPQSLSSQVESCCSSSSSFKKSF